MFPLGTPNPQRRSSNLLVSNVFTPIAGWLVIATLETYLAGHHETALAGAIISAVIFVTCFGLYLFIERMDAAVPER